ncbi:MAG TPA: efflux RND transporter periplasmic adaptor subunit [Burkholderiales bacterium]|nr:efflux RND transporter periplasmic adaptor subunit [Burkholderiales bacterium]
MSKGRRWFAAGTLLLLAGAVGIAAYFMRDGSAKEKGAGRPPPGVPVSVAAAVQRDVPFRIGAIGNVEPFSTVALKARIDGQIVAVNFHEGQQVSRGQVLFRLDPRPFEAALRQAQANALRDAAARDQAASQAKRYKELLDKKFVSPEAYAQFATNAQTAEAVAQASQAALESARLNLAYCTIASPIEGYAGRALLQAGNLVKANDVNPLVIINRVKPIFATFAVPEQQLAEIRKYRAEGPLHVEATAPGADKPLAEGKLVFVDNSVDAATGTIRLRAQFENRDLALWPGQFVQISLRLFEQAGAILVPTSAVQTGPDGQYVYVIDGDASAQVRPVVVERAEGELSVVKGLKAGERVVTSGALRLVPGAKVRVRGPAEAS